MRVERRKTPRRPVGWVARFSPEGGAGGWVRCHVVNVSEGGAGLVAPGADVDAGTRLTLALGDGDGGHAEIEGIVRHVALSPDGTAHFGIEFAPDQPAVLVTTMSDELSAALAHC